MHSLGYKPLRFWILRKLSRQVLFPPLNTVALFVLLIVIAITANIFSIAVITTVIVIVFFFVIADRQMLSPALDNWLTGATATAVIGAVVVVSSRR
jgi:hypothetical protein